MNNAPNKELLKKIDDAPLLISMNNARKKLKKPRNVYGDQTIFMLAILVMAVISYGLRPLAVCILSVVFCIITDMTGCFLTKKEYSFKDMSTIAYGLAVALMLPASVEYYIVIMGAMLAITVKHIFGGKDNYIFNPAAVSIAFLIICYPTQVLLYPPRNVTLEIFAANDVLMTSGIESYFVKNGAMPHLSVLDILMGSFVGPMGTTHILVLLVIGICLICRRSLSLAATVGGMSVMALLTFFFSPVQPAADAVVFNFISGFVLFGFIFLASDPQTLPLTNGGRLLFGISLGTITTIFRSTANIEGVFVFSLLVVNALSLYFDRLSFYIIRTAKDIIRYLRTNLGSFERMSSDVKQGKTPALTDTQEIMIEPVNFNMPPIDNKVTKVKRRKKFRLKDFTDNIAKNLAEKQKQGGEKKEDGSDGTSETDKREENKA